MTSTTVETDTRKQSTPTILRLPQIKRGLVEALTAAYATLIRRQRTASAAFVRWSTPHSRAHEFTWLTPGTETLLSTGRDLTIAQSGAVYDSINKMMATISLNPYERELLYGYPYVIGRRDGLAIRAPLFTIPISISAIGGMLLIHPEEDVLRFNSLPFRSEFETAAQEAALARLIQSTPNFPLQLEDLRNFVGALNREMYTDSTDARLDGTLAERPTEPKGAMNLKVIDNAACFIAPKTSCFLASDLMEISRITSEAVGATALGWLLGGQGNTPTTDRFKDSRRVFFPFGSNASQRRVALLAEDPENEIVVVQGPPGTGKSRTIANLACHLVAIGKRVLITAQKDKALEVVDAELRTLNLVQLPMTLLRQDRDSKQELRDRLDSIQKTRSAAETGAAKVREESAHVELVRDAESAEMALTMAINQEQNVERADTAVAAAANWLRRLRARTVRYRVRRKASRLAPRTTDVLGEETSARREALLSRSVRILETAAEHRTGEATRGERNQLREFSKLLGRNQTHYRNFSVFDRMKSEPERCEMLLKILPCWIMSPDDVARLFPCTPGLFDVVIIDEASQCDLPSMTPILYRAKQAVIAGDSKQMQAQRFAFTATQVAAQAWREHGVDKLDPDGWLDPARISLLELASIRGSEEVFLDEHFRSLPGIISFSNDRWYGGRMRLMRGPDDRRVGDPGTPIIQLHHVPDGVVRANTQENEAEAKALVAELKRLMENPGFAEASFGVICLFEQQVGLIQDLVAELVDEELRETHDLVVVNPDGFQGDERDVVLYSLSYDAVNMDQAALSARQADRPHLQGMLNVAFTRAREEIHIFHSAPIEKFGMASGEGTIRDWLQYASKVERTTFDPSSLSVTRAQSEFEVNVMKSLQAQGVLVFPQYPSCGFYIDLVAEKDGRRVAVECDGEIYHLDEHGELRVEDVQRQEILERAGWRVLRIPYRAWCQAPSIQVARVTQALTENGENDGATGQKMTGLPASSTTVQTIDVSTYEAAILHALRSGVRNRTEVLNAARINLGKARLGRQIKESLETAIGSLERRKLVIHEDAELFATDEGRTATLSTYAAHVSSGRKRGYYGSYRRYRGARRRW
jgi:very-short-patch-repair endonuclease/KaiC/GvpD/RAD55 family RecA-like ATPase